jgi:class 3 adenylate cyclase
MEPSSVKRRLTCILAADAVGYSKLMGQDEEGTIQVLSAHRAVIDGILAFHQGRIVSTAGDSVLAEFSSAVEAVRCAVEIQEALKTRNDSLPEHRKMHFRIGVNLGDVVVKNDDLLGDGVNVAARLETMAESGGICISSSVYDQITGKLDLGFQDIGEQHLKNISRPIRVYRVSGVSLPLLLPSSTPPVASTVRARGPLPWVVAAIGALAVVVTLAWQGGWVRFGANDANRTAVDVVPVLTPQPLSRPESGNAPGGAASVAASALAQASADAQRLRDEASAIKRQAEAELARARAQAESVRATKAKVQGDAEPATRVPEAPLVRAAVVPSERSGQPATVNVSRFDGVWQVKVECAKHEDGAAGYTVEFSSQVKDGVLRGEFGTEGNPGWLLLRGDIRPDGSAELHAMGLTADPRLSVKSVRKGTPYAYHVAAQFEGSRGSGRRLQLRACALTFVKQ